MEFWQVPRGLETRNGKMVVCVKLPPKRGRFLFASMNVGDDFVCRRHDAERPNNQDNRKAERNFRLGISDKAMKEAIVPAGFRKLRHQVLPVDPRQA